jgi:hypothetical protein
MVKVMCLYKKFLFIYRQAQMARFASSNCYSNALNPYFITGFTDAEGSFHISMYIYKSNSRIYILLCNVIKLRRNPSEKISNIKISWFKL